MHSFTYLTYLQKIKTDEAFSVNIKSKAGLRIQVNILQTENSYLKDLLRSHKIEIRYGPGGQDFGQSDTLSKSFKVIDELK